MKKVIQNGLVRVLYSPGFGAGFLTWGAPQEAIFDPELIQLIEQQNLQGAVDYVTATYPGIYTGGVPDLSIAEIPEGARFVITEYDGAETLDLLEEMNWITA
jgi:hypothetical protein